MKKLLTLTFIVLGMVTVSFGQSVTYNELQELEGRKYQKIKEYVAKDGTHFKVGDKVKIGYPVDGKFFAFVQTGDGIITPKESMPIKMANKSVEIKSMRIVGTRKNQAPSVIFGIADPLSPMLPRGSVDIENAIESGEVKTDTISSDDALAELKKAKDKLDLGLITQEEFDNLKLELSKYIK